MAKHRGKHSNDDKLFNEKWLPILSEATTDLSFLLGKGYGIKSAVGLVGNRYKLNARQQRALSLISCPSDKIDSRKDKALKAPQMSGKHIVIDGFNLLITIEAMLSGGYVFVAQDGCYRDIASIHGSYKRVEETLPAIMLIDQAIKKLNIAHAHWYFDKPVSNAGMLKTMLYEYATTHQANWDIDLVNNPDRTLVEKSQVETSKTEKNKIKTGNIVISSDSVVVDECEQYFNLSKYISDEFNIQQLCLLEPNY